MENPKTRHFLSAREILLALKLTWASCPISCVTVVDASYPCLAGYCIHSLDGNHFEDVRRRSLYTSLLFRLPNYWWMNAKGNQGHARRNLREVDIHLSVLKWPVELTHLQYGIAKLPLIATLTSFEHRVDVGPCKFGWKRESTLLCMEGNGFNWHARNTSGLLN